MYHRIILALLILLSVKIYADNLFPDNANKLTSEEQAWIDRANLHENAGWVIVHTEGEPMERGFQHGYILSNEFKEAWHIASYMCKQTTGMKLSFFIDKAVELYGESVPEYLVQEMTGIAAGLTRAGVATSYKQILGWNMYYELIECWWPLHADEYTSFYSRSWRKDKCSAFVATGSATKDGMIVIGHETFDDFWNGQAFNIALEIIPDDGFGFIMQCAPGLISSQEDFYINSAGIATVETSILGLTSYTTDSIPYFIRTRNAIQFSSTIDEFADEMNKGNNGGLNASWLIADINTNEIARFEQGLYYQSLKKKKDGYFYGCNVVWDPQIRNLECKSETGFNDPRMQTGARRIRWPQLLESNIGTIDAETGMAMLADTFDVYLDREQPSCRTICAHYDIDPREFAPPVTAWPNPYTPAGSTDGKVTTSDLAADLKFWGRIGRADGIEFDVDIFLKTHPEWSWQKGYLKSRPTQPWVILDASPN